MPRSAIMEARARQQKYGGNFGWAVAKTAQGLGYVTAGAVAVPFIIIGGAGYGGYLFGKTVRNKSGKIIGHIKNKCFKPVANNNKNNNKCIRYNVNGKKIPNFKLNGNNKNRN